VVPILPLVADGDYVVLIDDDVRYHATTIQGLLDARHVAAAVGYAGRKRLRYKDNPGAVDFLETFAGAMYRGHALRGLDKYNAYLGATCNRQDDIVIGSHMKKMRIKPTVVERLGNGMHNARGTPQLKEDNLAGDNSACYKLLF
jgi:hypothetical protein